jgi:hypothetical protein
MVPASQLRYYIIIRQSVAGTFGLWRRRFAYFLIVLSGCMLAVILLFGLGWLAGGCQEIVLLSMHSNNL